MTVSGEWARNYTRYNRRLRGQRAEHRDGDHSSRFSAAGGFSRAGGGQSGIDAKQQALLKRLFPAATAFSPKGGDPPHFKAFAPEPGSGRQTLLGLAFWTTELEPFERGYDGPIKILVGMDTKGLLTGVIVTEHHEPYGNFSVERPEFAAQFRGQEHSRRLQGRRRHRCCLARHDQRDECVARRQEQRAARGAATAGAARAGQVTRADPGDGLVLVPCCTGRRARPARSTPQPAQQPSAASRLRPQAIAGSLRTMTSKCLAGATCSALRPGTWDCLPRFTALALVSFFRKSVRLKYVTFAAAVLYLGFVKSQLISIVNVFALVDWNLPIFRYSLAWYLLATFTVLSTVLWGRVYCGRMCAFGALTQLMDTIVPAGMAPRRAARDRAARGG